MRTLPLCLGLLLAALSLTACSGSAVGTGTSSGSSGTSGGSSGSGFDDPSPPATSLPPAGTAPPPGPSAYDPLFEAPTTTTTTPGSLSGLWAGTTYTGSGDVRLKVSAGSILIAVRCGSEPAVGLQVTAQVSTSSIRVLASKSAGSTVGCGINVTPQTIPLCPSVASGEPRIGCFDMKGTTLSFEGIWLFSSGGYGPQDAFTKLSD